MRGVGKAIFWLVTLVVILWIGAHWQELLFYLRSWGVIPP
jgi:hypothetical protein